jgi:hypothetical protein
MTSQDELLRWLAAPAALILVVVGLTAAYNPPVSTEGIDDRPDFKGPRPNMPLQDTDGDMLADVEEVHYYHTNITNPDTDGDGIGDWWEVNFRVKDPHTGRWSPDPTNPEDAYDDPDNDGYDFNHNGYIDGSEQDPAYKGGDRVFLSRQQVPASAGYRTRTLRDLLSDPEEHRGDEVRVAGARVVDNGSYKPELGGLGLQIEREISINITDPSTNLLLPVILQARSNRPPDLKDDNSGIYVPADIIDVQGIFEGSGPDWRITVRGTERFTNLMEYLSARDYDYDIFHSINWTDPNKWDTDRDGMSDGWEVHYGCGYYNTSLNYPRWEWITDPATNFTCHFDPTSPDDAYGEHNPAHTDPDGDRIQVPDPLSGEMKWVGYNRDEYLTVLDDELLSMVPRSRLNLADLLGRPDIPRSLYAYGTDPTRLDTDRDSFDRGRDSRYTTDVDNNTNDFDEIFLTRTDPLNPDTDGDTMPDGWELHYGLDPRSPADQFEDPDCDILMNCEEFAAGTSPRLWDTDDEGLPRNDPHAIDCEAGLFDGLPDGWEVWVGLDPLNSTGDNGSGGDPDGDGFSNLEEFRAHTDPRDPSSHPPIGGRAQDE